MEGSKIDKNEENKAENRTAQRRFTGLDAIRTLAIAGVTFFHMFPDTIKGGYLGVSLFFVLTGFLLAYTTYVQPDFKLKDYFWKRFKRIYPELLVMLLVTIGAYSFILPKAVAGKFNEITSVVFGYNNWWQIAQNADYFARIVNSSPFTHLWFLGIEIQYYVAWPVLLFVYKAIKKCAGKKTGMLLLTVLALISAALMPIMYNPETDVTGLYYSTHTRLYALLMGAIIGLDAAEDKRMGTFKINSAGKLLAFVSCIITLAAYILMGGQASFTYQGGMLLMTILFCFLLCLIINSDLGEKLENPICKFFSKYSYGIFLWQYPVIYLFSHMPFGKIPGSSILQLVLICVLAVWSNYFTDCLLKKQLPFKDVSLVGWRKHTLSFVAVLSIALMCVGAKTFVCSYGYEDLEMKEFQAQMEANKKKLAEENAAAEKAAHEQAVNLAKGQVDLRGIVCIGDSVMLGSSSALRKELPGCYIDAAVSRYVGDGVQIAQQLKANGKLGKIVLIHLGTNGPIAGYERYEKQTKKLIEVLGPDRDIFWVNFYCPDTTWQDTNNAYLSNIICGYHSNIHLVNWYAMVHDKPELLVGDRIHPNGKGMKVYGELVRETITNVMAEKNVKFAKQQQKQANKKK